MALKAERVIGKTIGIDIVIKVAKAEHIVGAGGNDTTTSDANADACLKRICIFVSEAEPAKNTPSFEIRPFV